MPYINWDPSFSVGVGPLDGQHQTLFQIINRFYDAMEMHAPQAVLSAIFGEVLDYTNMHFKLEEAIMRRYSYPGFERHRQYHQQLVARAVAIKSDIDAGQRDAPRDALRFLTDWLEKHIKGCDVDYSPYMSKLGAA